MVQRFLKRLRKAIYPRKVRYFLVGEYGEEKQRPHYHLALFGYGACATGGTWSHPTVMCPCRQCTTIFKAWRELGHQIGRISVDRLEKESAQYIAGYVTKKLTQPDSDQNKKYREEKGLLLGERIPEYARMSNRPGIGAEAAKEIADALASDAGCDYLLTNGDCPQKVKIGPREVSLGRYIRTQTRKWLGFEDGKTSPEAQAKYKAMLLEVYKEYRQENPEFKKRRGTIKEIWYEKNYVKNRQIETRTEIHSRKGKL